MEEKKNSIITQKDILILKELLEDGRKSSSKISKEIDLGREIVNYRIKRLIKENLIVKFIPEINQEALNYKEYIIFLKLNLEDEISRENFIKETIGNKYLIWLTKSNSGWDVVVRLYAENVEEFKKKLEEILNLFSEVLTRYYTIISSTQIKTDEKQRLCQELFDSVSITKDHHRVKETKLCELDAKDKEIIEILENDGRIQYKEIAKIVGTSSDTVKYRIEKMKNQGIIENFTPVINFSKIGFIQIAAIIKFEFLSNELETTIKEYLKNHPLILKAISSLNAEEFFITLISKNKGEYIEFETKLEEISQGKLRGIDFFELN